MEPISLNLTVVYATNKLKEYADNIAINTSNKKSSTAIYSGISTTVLLEKISDLQEFFQHKQVKYNRRRDSKHLKDIEKGYLPRKNIVQYVSFCL